MPGSRSSKKVLKFDKNANLFKVKICVKPILNSTKIISKFLCVPQTTK